MAENNASPDPQNDSISEALPPSGTPSNQANRAPVTESKKIKTPNSRFSYQRSRKRVIRKKYIAVKNPQKNTAGLFNSSKTLAEIAKDKLKDKLQNINKYIAEDNPVIDNKEINKKYPIDTLASIFKIQKKDHKIIFWISVFLVAHIISYYLKWTYLVDLLRIIITTIFLLFVIKNTYSAYQNRPIIVDSFKKHPLQFFTTIIAIGGLFALVIPAAMNVLKLIGDSSALTTAILTITGGFIAVFGLIKSHQKSELEREQLEVQKQKDARDHIRQLHNSYNDRFDKAVAELNGSDVKASYTAVPKLAKLADAWLDYKDLSNDTKELEKLKDKAEKEAQTIINILCKYIRTIPNNYTHEQLKEFKSLPESDIEILTHEADIRRLIFSEISKRSSTFTRDGFGKIIDISLGTWSDFEFDFSRAPIFYPLSSLTIEKGNFSSAKFYSNADFSGATFTQTADFSKATFTQTADFSWAAFTQTADFSEATFTQTVRFHVTKFTQDANFRWATFTQTANFRSATFASNVDFRQATFERFEPTFATKLGKARFSAGTSPQNYMFSVAPDSKPINCKPATLLGKTFIIPLGTVLFDPDSPPKDHLGNYTVQSAPAE